MSAVDALGTSTTGAGVAPNAFSSLSSESFVKIIFTELGHQDPLQPSDSKALLDQLSSLRTIQSSIDMSSRLGSLVAQNELSAASGLIGKNISGITDQFERVSGTVQSVSRTGDGAILNLKDGTKVRMTNVDGVLGQPPAPVGGGA
jgi:flagellar basal-body rod modification protein FlgD